MDQKGPVGVRALLPLDAAQMDLAVVLDTASDVPGDVYRRARRVVTALLESLPTGIRVTVVAAGGNVEVQSPLGTDRGQAFEALMDAPRRPGHAWLDAITSAVDAFPDAPNRFQEVVIVTTGPDDASEKNLLTVWSELTGRHIPLSIIEAGVPTASAPWGDQCPREVAHGQAAAAGQLVARRVSERYVVVAPSADFAEPLTVRVSRAGVDVSAAVAASVRAAPSSDTKVDGRKVGQRIDGGQGTRWITIGLGLLVALLLGYEVADWKNLRR